MTDVEQAAETQSVLVGGHTQRGAVYDDMPVQQLTLSTTHPHLFKEAMLVTSKHWDRHNEVIGAVAERTIGNVDPSNGNDPMGTFAIGTSNHGYHLKYLTGSNIPLYLKAKIWSWTVTMKILFDSSSSALDTWVEEGLYFLMWSTADAVTPTEFTIAGGMTEHQLKNGTFKSKRWAWKFWRPVRTVAQDNGAPFTPLVLRQTVYMPEILGVTRKEYLDDATFDCAALATVPWLSAPSQATRPITRLHCFTRSGTAMASVRFDVEVSVETHIMLTDRQDNQ